MSARARANEMELEQFRQVGAAARVVVILVHGTFAAAAPWVQSGGLCRTTLADAGPQRAVAIPFTWSGDNSVLARLKASAELTAFVHEILFVAPEVALGFIAHSHGGNVVGLAMRDAQVLERTRAMVTLGTPFITIQKTGTQMFDYIGSILANYCLWLGYGTIGLVFGTFAIWVEPVTAIGLLWVATWSNFAAWSYYNGWVFRAPDYLNGKFWDLTITPFSKRQTVVVSRSTMPALGALPFLCFVAPGDEARLALHGSYAVGAALLSRFWMRIAWIVRATTVLIIAALVLAGVTFVPGFADASGNVVNSLRFVPSLTVIVVLASIFIGTVLVQYVTFGVEPLADAVTYSKDVSLVPTFVDAPDVVHVTVRVTFWRRLLLRDYVHNRLLSDQAVWLRVASWLRTRLGQNEQPSGDGGGFGASPK